MKTKADDIRNAFENYNSIGEHGYRHFAVLIPVIVGNCDSDEESLSLLYEVRAAKLDRQPGEICFPGGLIEEGESPLECALRETYEEVGIDPQDIDVVTKFDAISTVSGSQIHSFIGFVDENILADAQFSEAEVAETFTVSIDELRQIVPEEYYSKVEQNMISEFPYEKVTGEQKYSWRGGKIPVPIYEIDGRAIWGLTGRLTKQFLEVLEDSEVSDV